MHIIEHFDALTKLGLKIIPLRVNSKAPICRNWQRKWDREEARSYFERNDNLNMGILLGNVIDIEGDSPSANGLIDALVKDKPHPVYCSSKSKHHLFLNPDPNLTIFKYRQIEFRGWRHQSVIPPSRHYDGTIYQWHKDFFFPIPEMPPRLLQFFEKARNIDKIKHGHIKAYCSICKRKRFLHRKRWNLELIGFQELGFKWSCHDCREFDMRAIVRKIRKRDGIYNGNREREGKTMVAS
jgi:hypothetical protein